MTRLAVFLATAAYSGYAPKAPGTVGSAVGLLLYALIWRTHSSAIELLTIVVVFAAGVWSASIAERHFGGTDPGAIVIDEVLGMLMTLALIPVGLWGAVTGFALFRIFDVVKPYPASKFEELHGGLGVMADDAMAGVYANLSLRLLLMAFPGWIG